MQIVESVGGKSVISANHGELLGERLGVGSHRRYGHDRRLHRLRAPRRGTRG
ncbi:MAG: hypothetical protein ACOCPX_02160 [Halapricum sp.]